MNVLKLMRQNHLSLHEEFGENRFLRFSYAWFFAKYYNLLHHDLEADIPLRFNLTQEDALRYLPPGTSSWTGRIQDLGLDLAVEIYRKKYWQHTLIEFVYGEISSMAAELLAYFQSIEPEADIATIGETASFLHGTSSIYLTRMRTSLLFANTYSQPCRDFGLGGW